MEHDLALIGRRNAGWAILILVLAVPATLGLLYVLSLTQLLQYALYAYFLALLVLGVGAVFTGLRARKQLPETLPVEAEVHANFRGLSQLVSFGGNLVVALTPFVALLIWVATRDNDARTHAYVPTILVAGVVLLVPFASHALLSTVSAFWWRLRERVAVAELYAVRHKLGRYRLIIIARMLNSALTVLGVAALFFYALNGFGALL